MIAVAMTVITTATITTITTATVGDFVQEFVLDDTVGLLYEPMGTLKRQHVTGSGDNKRIVFVKRFDFHNVLHQLKTIYTGIMKYQDEYVLCDYTVSSVNLNRINQLVERINECLATLPPIHNEFIRYTWDDDDIINNNKNKNNNDVIDIESDEYFDDYYEITDKRRRRLDDNATIVNRQNWNEPLNVHTAKQILATTTPTIRGDNAQQKNDTIVFLPEFTANEWRNTFTDYNRCLVNRRTLNNTCRFAVKMMSSLTTNIQYAYKYIMMLEKLKQQWLLNKLPRNQQHLSNLTEQIILGEMAKQMNEKNNRIWMTNNNNFSRRRLLYKLHLFFDKNYAAVMFITVPPMNVNNGNSTLYNLYRVVSIPFCRGKICLIIIPSHEYVAISINRNYFMFVVNIQQMDTICFNACIDDGYPCYICPNNTTIGSDRPLATINSRVCEVELYMGRAPTSIEQLISVCDIRIANVIIKEAYVLPIASFKWLYLSLSKEKKINVKCRAFTPLISIALSYRSGILQCINNTINSTTITTTTTTTTTIYQHRFSYTDYFNSSLLIHIDNPLSFQKLTSLNRSTLLTLEPFTTAKMYANKQPHKTTLPSYHFHYTTINNKNNNDDNSNDNKRTHNIIWIICASVGVTIALTTTTIVLLMIYYRKKITSQSVSNNNLLMMEQKLPRQRQRQQQQQQQRHYHHAMYDDEQDDSDESESRGGRLVYLNVNNKNDALYYVPTINDINM
jgi:hypothetical protein